MPRAPAGWRTSKRPPWKVPVWLPSPGTAELRVTVPLRASTIEPTGIEAASVSATARAEPGRRTSTLPACAATPTLWPSSGGAGGREHGRRAGVPGPVPGSEAGPAGAAAGQRRRAAAGRRGSGAAAREGHVGAERQAVVVAGDEARVVGRALEQPRHDALHGRRGRSCRSCPAGCWRRRPCVGPTSNQYVVRCWPASTVPCSTDDGARDVESARASGPPARSRRRPGRSRPPARTAAASAREHGHDGSTKSLHDHDHRAVAPKPLSGLDQRASGQVMTFVAASTITIEPERDAIGRKDADRVVHEVAQQEGDRRVADDEGQQRGERRRARRGAAALAHVAQLEEPGQHDGRHREQERVARRGGAIEVQEQAGGDRGARARHARHERQGLRAADDQPVAARDLGQLAIASRDGLGAQHHEGEERPAPSRRARACGTGPRSGS